MNISFGQAYSVQTPSLTHANNLRNRIEDDANGLRTIGEKSQNVTVLPFVDYQNYSALCGSLIGSGVKAELAVSAAQKAYENSAQTVDLSNPEAWKYSS